MTNPIIVDLSAGGSTAGGTDVPANPFAARPRGGDGSIKGIVFHHTGPGDLAGVLRNERLTGMGANYYIDTDGTIYNYIPDAYRSYNIERPSAFGRTDVSSPTAALSNSNTIGIEIIAADSDHMTAAQKAAAVSLGTSLQQKYSIDPSMIVGHGDLQGGQEIVGTDGTVLRQGNRMSTEGVSVAQMTRQNVAGLLPASPTTAIAAIDAAVAAPVPRIPASVLGYGYGTPAPAAQPWFPAPAPLVAPIQPANSNASGGLQFSPGMTPDEVNKFYTKIVGVPDTLPASMQPSGPVEATKVDRVRATPNSATTAKAFTRDVYHDIIPANGIVIEHTGQQQSGRPVVEVSGTPTIDRAPIGETPVDFGARPLPPLLFKPQSIWQAGPLTFTAPKTLALALAGTNYATAGQLLDQHFSKPDPIINPSTFTVPPPQPAPKAAPPVSTSIVKPQSSVLKITTQGAALAGTVQMPAGVHPSVTGSGGFEEPGKVPIKWSDLALDQPTGLSPPVKIKPAAAVPTPAFRNVTVTNPDYLLWQKEQAAAPGTVSAKANDRDGFAPLVPAGTLTGGGVVQGGAKTAVGSVSINGPDAPAVPPAVLRPAPAQTIVKRIAIAAPRPAAGAPSSSGGYVIQKGDTLSAIAARNGTTVAALQRANGISDPNLIYAGKNLVIPTKSGSTSAAPSKSNGAPQSSAAPPAGSQPIFVSKSTGERLTPQVILHYNADTNQFENRTVYRAA